MSEKVQPSKYWKVVNSTDWTCNLVDPQGYYGAYIKGDGCVNLWTYKSPKSDLNTPSPSYQDEDESYRHICDIDDEITRLLALREMAIRYFEAHGTGTHEDWYYGKPFAETIETILARTPEQHRAMLVAIEEEERQQHINNMGKLGIVENDIPRLRSIEYDNDVYTIKLDDGRSWQKTIEEVSNHERTD